MLAIELPTHYSEVNHRTPKVVVSYGPNIGHIPFLTPRLACVVKRKKASMADGIRDLGKPATARENASSIPSWHTRRRRAAKPDRKPWNVE
ncbi:hypothetical protein KY290_003844 [Solanum tuberosum]|uniref:Uncharacterized protein n=1 Tax=Solanum tuberosum TaxID=4113 RepID=A0ABQ7WVG5_SOLTU|nr:hypothetical protein KY285_001179 [Solanum tuberosum]KAH0784246.1 hypothetical protein KY290_003844 [Solanum tuberosum]